MRQILLTDYFCKGLRLCEEEGIWYAFEQHEQHGDVVVFGDSPEHYWRSQGLPVSYRPHAGLESVGTEALFNLSIRHNPIVEGIRTADYNYRSADTDLFAEADNKQSEESADNTVLLGKQQHWGLHPKTTDEVQVQTTLLNEANLCRQTVAAGSGNVVSMTPMKVFQTDVSFPEAPDGWLVLSMEHSGSRDTAYSHTFTAIPAQLAYRPERTTPRPHISVNLFAQSSGIKMQANQGKVEVQAQNDELQLNALKDATLTSSAGKVTIAAKEEILITCKGAYIKLSNGEVEIGSPKVVRVRAPLVVNGAKEMIFKLPMYPKISKNCLYTANMERSIYVLRPKD